MTEAEVQNLSTFNHANFRKLLNLVSDHRDIISTEVVPDVVFHEPEEAVDIEEPEDNPITEGSED